MDDITVLQDALLQLRSFICNLIPPIISLLVRIIYVVLEYRKKKLSTSFYKGGWGRSVNLKISVLISEVCVFCVVSRNVCRNLSTSIDPWLPLPPLVALPSSPSLLT